MYKVVYADEHMVDSFEVEGFETAKSEVLDILWNWRTAYVNQMQDANNPTEQEIEDYNYYIENGCVYVEEDDEPYWYPSEEDLQSVGWVPWEDWVKQGK